MNWNWARFEWMLEHPSFDKSLINLIGLWLDDEKIVGSAIFDMYLGEASVLVLDNYSYLYNDILNYAYDNLKDENGLGIAINERSKEETNVLINNGFIKNSQKEVVLSLEIGNISYKLPKGYSVRELDLNRDFDEIEWAIYQGFDHGNDIEEFNKTRSKAIPNRPHLNPYLNLAIENENGEISAFCAMWYNDKTDYVYIEPLCVIPSERRKHIGSCLVKELLIRSKSLGAKIAYVISDLDFYKSLGFKEDSIFYFYFKK